MLSVSEKHEPEESETVCSCVAMRKLNRPLVAIICHITLWYRYHHLNVRILLSTFQLAFSMGTRYFKKVFFIEKLSFTYIVEYWGSVFSRGPIFGFWFLLELVSRSGSGEKGKPCQIGLIK